MTTIHFKFNHNLSFVKVKCRLILLFLAIHWLEIAWFVNSLCWTCTWPSTFQFSHFHSSQARTITEERWSKEYWSAPVLYISVLDHALIGWPAQTWLFSCDWRDARNVWYLLAMSLLHFLLLCTHHDTKPTTIASTTMPTTTGPMIAHWGPDEPEKKIVKLNLKDCSGNGKHLKWREG